MDKNKLKQLKEVAKLLDARKSGQESAVLFGIINSLREEVAKLQDYLGIVENNSTKKTDKVIESINQTYSSIEDKIEQLTKENLKLSKDKSYSDDYFKQELRTLKNVIADLKTRKPDVIIEKTEVIKEIQPIDTDNIAIEASKMAVDECKTLIPVIPPLAPEIVKNGESVRDSLELLTGEDRLSAKYIKDLPKPQTHFIGGVTEQRVADMIATHDTLQGVTDRGATTTNSITAQSFIKTGGLSTEFLKADGSSDSTAYLSTTTAASTYVPYQGAIADANLNTKNVYSANTNKAQFIKSIDKLATVVGTPTVVDNAVVFNGTTDYLTVEADPAFDVGTNDFAFGCWFYSGAATNGYLAGQGNVSSTNGRGFAIRKLSDTSINLLVNNGSGATEIPLNYTTPLGGAWHHVIVVLDRTNNLAKLYFDGAKVQEAAFVKTGSFSSTTTNMAWGRGSAVTGVYYTGSMDGMLFFNGAPTDAEILTIYQSGRTHSPITRNLTTQYLGSDYSGTTASPVSFYNAKDSYKYHFDYWKAGNVINVPVGADINDYIVNATNGDTLVLGAGTYTTGAVSININKSIKLVGQGRDRTFITATGTYAISNTNVGDITISDLFITLNSAAAGAAGIIIGNTGLDVFNNIVIENVNVITNSSSSGYGIRISNTNAIVRNVNIDVYGTPSVAYGMSFATYAAATVPATGYFDNVKITASTSTGTTAYGLYVFGSSATQNAVAYLTNSRIKTYGASGNNRAIFANTSLAYVYATNNVLDGSTADLYQGSSATIVSTGNILVNNLIAGLPTHNGTFHVAGIAGRNAVFGNIGASTSTATPVNVSFGSTFGSNTPGDVGNLKWDLFTSSSSGSRYGIGMSSGLMEFQAATGGGHGFFVNGGTEVMRILSTSRVGIGTATPSALFDVGGKFTAPPTSLSTMAPTAYITADTNTINGVVMGNANTGTTADYRFAIRDSLDSYVAFQYAGSGRTSTAIFGLANNTFASIFTNGAAANARHLILGTVQEKDLIFGTNNLERMRVLSDGKVGIGTAAPTHTLHVKNLTTALGSTFEGREAGTSIGGGSGIFVVNSDDITNNYAAVYFGDTTSNIATSVSTQFTDRTNHYGDLAFATRSASGFTPKMRILSGGNVGIGTTAPVRQLHINSATTAAYFCVTNSDTGATATDGFQFAMSGLDALLINREAGSLFFRTSDTNRLRVTATGDLYILADNQKAVWGAGQDASITYDGTNMLINPKEVGTGYLSVLGGLKTDGQIIGKITTATDTYGILDTDSTVVCDKATPFTVTLPTAVVGQIFSIKNIGAGLVTVDGAGSDTIDGALTQDVYQWACLKLQCNAANNWIII